MTRRNRLPNCGGLDCPVIHFAHEIGPERRHAIRRTLSILAPDHPARLALEQDADAVTLMQLVDRDDLAEALREIWFEAYRRRLEQEQKPKP